MIYGGAGTVRADDADTYDMAAAEAAPGGHAAKPGAGGGRATGFARRRAEGA